MKITKALHDKQKPKIIKKYQYTNCTNCTNFSDFNEVTILYL